MPSDPHTKGGTIDQRQSACDLKFGTSTGALGLRKFPNPRFDAQKWKQVNGGSRRQLGRLPQADDQDDRHSVGRAREQARRCVVRTAVPDRHGLRLVPHRVRPAQSAQGSRASEVGEHQGPRRQPVFAHVGAPGLGNAEDQHRVADVHACAPGRHRHVGDLARPGQQSGHDEFDHQSRAASALRGRGHHQMAQGRHVRRREGRRQVLVRAGSRQQVLAAQHAQRRQDAGHATASITS